MRGLSSETYASSCASRNASVSARSASSSHERWRNSTSGTSGARRAGARASSAFAASRLREARVVLEEDAAELAGELERLERRPEEAERLVGRLALVPRHRRRRLDVEGEVVGRPAGPALGHGGVGQGVVGRVDLDDVEALGVVAEALLGGRDTARVPGLQQALVRPRARPDPHGGRHARTIDGAPVRAPRPFLATGYLTRTSPDCAVKPLTVPLTQRADGRN